RVSVRGPYAKYVCLASVGYYNFHQTLGIVDPSRQRNMMSRENGCIELEKSPERLKVVLPVSRNWLFFSLFSVCLLVWIAMLVGIVAAMLREHYGFVLNVMLLVWLVVWLWFGRVLWRRWQYYAAGREILFIYEKKLIIRRPVSILGPTDVYDMGHVSPFYMSEKHHCPVFDYGFQHVYFGHSLNAEETEELINILNSSYFPGAIDD
ncbi:MAG: hypothetical protein ACE5FQ_15970, partial [Thiogranum sp.]